MLRAKKGVRFLAKAQVATFQCKNDPVMITYNPRADGNYVSKEDRLRAVGMLILQKTTK